MNKTIQISLLALLGYACNRPDQMKPEPKPDPTTETLILLRDNEFNVNALNGKTGQVQWSLPFRYDLTENVNRSQSGIGPYTIADKKLRYYTKPELAWINSWSDTTALFVRLPGVNVLGTIDAKTGQKSQETALKVSPGFALPCESKINFCTNARYYQWLGVNEGVTILESIQTTGPGTHFDRKLHAINTDSGAVLWTFSVEDEYPTVTIDNGRVYIGDTHQSYVIDLKSGAKIQEYAVGSVIPPFTSNRFFRPPGARQVVVADAQTGAVKWTAEIGNTPADLAIANGLVITKVEDRNLIQARDAATGTVKWSFSDPTSGGFISLQVVNNTLYTMSRTSYVYAIDLATGYQKWKTVQFRAVEILAKTNLIYLRQTGHQLLGLDPSTGEKVWECFFMRDSPTKTIYDFAVFDRNELDF